MHQITATIFTFRLLLLLSVGATATGAWALQRTDPEFRPLQGSFMLYSFGLGDPQPARKEDSKIAFSIEGEAARKMFESMAPDVRDVCTEGSGVRVRRKGHVSCQRETGDGYRCSFGFDLRTGKSIAGSVC